MAGPFLEIRDTEPTTLEIRLKLVGDKQDACAFLKIS
jgi:hypothetical protein